MRVDFDTTTPIILVCSPERAGVRPPHPEYGFANKFEESGFWEFFHNPKAYQRNLHQQFRERRAAFRAFGAKIPEIEPQEDMFDLHFTADQSFSRVTPVSKANGKPVVYDAVTIMSCFTNIERQPEVGVVARFFRDHMPERRVVHSAINCEGTGDAVLDVFRGLIWSGHAPGTPSRRTAALGRSDIRAHKMYEEITGLGVIAIPLRWPFYHVDVPLGFLSRGHVLCCEEGLQPEGFRKLKHEAFERYGLAEKDYLIPVSKEDAEKGACNIRCLANTVFVSTGCSVEYYDALRGKGYEVVATPLFYYGVQGGWGHCGSNHTNEVCLPGGYAARIGIERKPDLVTLER